IRQLGPTKFLKNPSECPAGGRCCGVPRDAGRNCSDRADVLPSTIIHVGTSLKVSARPRGVASTAGVISCLLLDTTAQGLGCQLLYTPKVMTPMVGGEDLID